MLRRTAGGAAPGSPPEARGLLRAAQAAPRGWVLVRRSASWTQTLSLAPVGDNKEEEMGVGARGGGDLLIHYDHTQQCACLLSA